MIFHSLTDLFTNTDALEHPVAMRCGEAISFRRFKADVAAFAGKYNNCRAALICDDSYNYLVGFFGLLYGGATFLNSSAAQLDAQPALAKDYPEIIDDAAVENLSPTQHRLTPCNPNRQAIHFLTSGSTGEPKLVVKNLHNFEVEVSTLDLICTKETGTVFSTIPHCHVYGLVFKLLWPLATQKPFDTTTHIFLEDLLDNLTSQAIIISSPAHLRRIEGIKRIPAANIPAQIFSAGSPLDEENIKNITAILGQSPTEIFGSTETGTIAWRHPSQAAQIWQPFKNIKLRNDVAGRMEILSPHVSPDWYRTDDLITLSGEGFHYLGRSDSVVKVECRRVSLVAVEKALCALDYISEAAAILVPGKTDHLAAVAVLSQSGKAQLAALGSFRFAQFLRRELRPNLERLAIPRLWRFVDTIPTKGMGKRNPEMLQELFAPR